MRYGSVASGIEAASTAWSPLGWQAAFLSEIEPFPCHVLHEHYSSGRPQFMPDPEKPGLKPKDRKARLAAIKAVMGLPERANGVPNYGDMTQFEEWPDHAIDLLVGGTPCQDYSVAGLRAGMDGVRGSLTLTYAAIARRYRPRWLVWENVFGVLSSKGGRDFASLLGLLSGRRIEVPSGGWKSSGIVEGYSGAYGLSWRVLDTQYVRVDGAPRALPQRRRRVFVVGHTGGDWRRAAAVLLEREGLSGNPAPRREPGKSVAPTIAARPTGGGGLGTDFDLDGGQTAVSACDVADTLSVGANQTTGFSGDDIAAFGGGRCSGPVDVAARLAAHGVRQDFEVETFIATRPVAATLTRGAESAGKGGYAGRRQEDDDNLVGHSVAPAITSNPYGDHESREGLLVAHSLRPEGFDASEDGTGRGTPLIAVPAEIAGTMKACKDSGGWSNSADHAAAGYMVPYTLAIRGRDGVPDLEYRQDGVANAILTPNGGRAGVGVGAIAHAIQAGALRENPSSGPDGVGVQEGIAYTIEARAEVQAVQMQWAVRRLTPTECARLQGFPDDHCRIPWRGKPAEQCPDGPQYKAYGNSMSTNVMRWLGERIEMVEQIAADLEKEFAA